MGASILLLDSDRSFREQVSYTLSARGFEVKQAGQGEEATKMFNGSYPELIVVDGLLPDMTGIDFISKLRDKGVASKIIFMTGFWKDIKTFDRLIRELGVLRVINKPATANELMVQIESALNHEETNKKEENKEALMQSHPAPEPESKAVEAPKKESGYANQVSSLLKGNGNLLEDNLFALGDAISEAQIRFDNHKVISKAYNLANQVRLAAGSQRLVEVRESVARIEEKLQHMLIGKISPDPIVWSQLHEALYRANKAFSKYYLEDNEGGHHTSIANILVVDSDMEFQAEVELMGQQNLIHVIPASNEAEALVRAQATMRAGRDALDGAIIDIHMNSGENCFRIARRLRALNGLAQLPVTFIARDGSIPNRIAAVHAGASLFLTKPLENEDFVKAVQHLANLRHREKPRIMILDDDAESVESITAVLEQERMNVHHLTDPSRVLNDLEENRPDLLLLDTSMPWISGLDLCKMLRSYPAWQDLPIVFMTSSDDPYGHLDCFMAGGDDYLEKPCLPEELLARVKVRLERARLFKERADRDMLTGLLNRRAFVELLGQRLSEAQRKLRPVSLCMIDLDHFKKINDTYGHLAGDRVLAGLGKLLTSRFRTEDLRGRWGGEEFIIALHGEGVETSKAILERILVEFSEMEFYGDHGENFQVSFSAGISCFPDDGTALEDLIRLADKKLYQAKDKGRFRVEG